MDPRTTDPVVPPQELHPPSGAPTRENGCLPEPSEEDVDEWDRSYKPVPPRRSVVITVHYRFRGRGQPLPYDLDEEDGE
jgi:hypothetical protein